MLILFILTSYKKTYIIIIIIVIIIIILKIKLILYHQNKPNNTKSFTNMAKTKWKMSEHVNFQYYRISKYTYT